MEQTESYERVKFTAVEWLYLQLIENPKTPWNDIFEQAKEMEKEQIENAYQDGWMSCEKWFEDERLEKETYKQD